MIKPQVLKTLFTHSHSGASYNFSLYSIVMQDVAFVSVLFLLALVCMLLLWIIFSYRQEYVIKNARYVKSDIDNQWYRVHLTHSNPKEAANTLALLNHRIKMLLMDLQGKYSKELEFSFRGKTRKKVTQVIVERYDWRNLVENSPLNPDRDTSYTLDKGAEIALCLRHASPPSKVEEIHDLNTLTFVALHELAHLGIEETGHPLVFMKTFRFLLESAEEAGIYKSPDYYNHPKEYCGIVITYNPRWDENVVPI